MFEYFRTSPVSLLILTHVLSRCLCWSSFFASSRFKVFLDFYLLYCCDKLLVMQTTLGKFGLMDTFGLMNTSESVFVRNTSVLYVV